MEDEPAAGEGPSFLVHRLRFGDWVPSPITTIAADLFSPKVAIGREDGYIEVADSSCKWHVAVRVPGRSNFGLKSLVWASVASQSGRLFGISIAGFIFEVSLATLSIKNVRDSYGGSAICLAASAQAPVLAVGCEDGVARLFSYGEGDQLEYVRSLPSAGCRVLSLCFHPAPSGAFSEQGQLFLGCADGTIRCVDAATGRAVFRMMGDVTRGATTQIWSLLCLSDSTVVSGDSQGHVQLWDGVTGVLMVSLHQHTAEVLALAASPDENQIFAAGVDSRTTCIRRVVGRPRGASLVDAPSFTDAMNASDPTDPLPPALAGGGGGAGGGAAASAWPGQDSADAPSSSSRASAGAGAGAWAGASPADSHWVYTSSHRPHSHDVFALAVCRHTASSSSSSGGGGGSSGKGTAMLVSGGLDCKLCTYSLSDFTRERPSWVLPTPCRGLVHASRDYRTVVMRHQARLDVWCVRLVSGGGAASAAAASSSPSAVASASATAPGAGSSGKGKRRKSDAADPTPATSSPSSAPLKGGPADPDACSLALQLVTAGPDHLHCSALSACGRLLAASGVGGTRLWLLVASGIGAGAGKGASKGNGEGESLSAVKIPLPAACAAYAHALAFTPDSRRLIVCSAAGVVSFADIELRGQAKGRAGGRGKAAAAAASASKGRAGRGKGRRGSSAGDDDDEDNNNDEEEEEQEENSQEQEQAPAVATLGGSVDHRAVVCDTRFVPAGAGSSSDAPTNASSSSASAASFASSFTSASERQQLGLEAAVSDLSLSRDGAFLALSDGQRRVYVYETDAQRLFWRLPILPAPVSATAFHPHQQRLVVLLASAAFLVFDLAKLAATPESLLAAAALPQLLAAAVHGPLQGIAFDPSPGRSRMLLHSQGACVYVDLALALPAKARLVVPSDPFSSSAPASGHAVVLSSASSSSSAVPALDAKQRKRQRRELEGTGPGLALVTDYRSLVHVGCLEGPQMVVVENPWVRILEQLPDTLARKRYGT